VLRRRLGRRSLRGLRACDAEGRSGIGAGMAARCMLLRRGERLDTLLLWEVIMSMEHRCQAKHAERAH
jgi:hypothetical protein